MAQKLGNGTGHHASLSGLVFTSWQAVSSAGLHSLVSSCVEKENLLKRAYALLLERNALRNRKLVFTKLLWANTLVVKWRMLLKWNLKKEV
jgi:hypothetical protein